MVRIHLIPLLVNSPKPSANLGEVQVVMLQIP